MKKLSIAYHYFAHYREPVLRALSQSLQDESSLELLADVEANLPNLRTVNLVDQDSEKCHFVKLRNVWIGVWLWQVGLIRAVFRNKSDVWVFLGQFSFISTWGALLIARILGKKTYLWTHGIYGNEGFFKKTLRLFFYRLADGLLLYGDYSKKLLIEAGFPESSLHVVYNSLDYEQQKDFRDSKRDTDISLVRERIFGSNNTNTPYVIFIGRLTSVKQLDMLIESISKLRLEHEVPVNCLLVGDGPERSALESLAADFEVSEYIRFYGACHDEEMLSDLIYAAEVCVAPGNVGLTAMHSLVYGTPVVTHDEKSWQMPEFEAITAGRTGSFFKRDNVDDLTLQIKTWVSRSDQRHETRIACYKVIDEKYNPRYQAKVITSLMDEEKL